MQHAFAGGGVGHAGVAVDHRLGVEHGAHQAVALAEARAFLAAVAAQVDDVGRDAQAFAGLTVVPTVAAVKAAPVPAV
jgi:hypothetical protein